MSHLQIFYDNVFFDQAITLVFEDLIQWTAAMRLSAIFIKGFLVYKPAVLHRREGVHTGWNDLWFPWFFFLNGILARRVAIGLNPVETVEIFFVAQVLANVPYCVSLERKKRNKKKNPNNIHMFIDVFLLKMIVIKF